MARQQIIAQNQNKDVEFLFHSQFLSIFASVFNFDSETQYDNLFSYNFRSEFDQSRGTSLTGLESIPEQFDEYGQPIISDKAYRKQLARDRWHWAFTKIVQVRKLLKLFCRFLHLFWSFVSHFDLCFFGSKLVVVYDRYICISMFKFLDYF